MASQLPNGKTNRSQPTPYPTHAQPLEALIGKPLINLTKPSIYAVSLVQFQHLGSVTSVFSNSLVNNQFDFSFAKKSSHTKPPTLLRCVMFLKTIIAHQIFYCSSRSREARGDLLLSIRCWKIGNRYLKVLLLHNCFQ